MSGSARVMTRPAMLDVSDDNGLNTFTIHCNDPFYVFLFWELRCFSSNFQIHVSVSDLYIPRIGPHIFPHILLQQNRQTDPGNI